MSLLALLAAHAPRPTPHEGLVETVARAFGASGVPLDAVGLAWARVTPTVALVPAFGLKALPAPTRGVLGVALAVCIFPAFAGAGANEAASLGGPAGAHAPWVLLALLEMARGLPLALATAIPLWAATMAGGLVDALRGAQDTMQVVAVEGRATPLGVPFSLLASAIFLAMGGPSRVVLALATRPLEGSPVLAVTHDLTMGIGFAVALAAPLLAAAVLLEIAAALIARAAAPAQIHALVAPLRAIGLLAVTGLVLDRVGAVMATSMTP